VAGELRVVATAGHVDHGKSSLIVRLTGIDPDRFAEEKRRGLTIDLGYAWCTLPSGREVGFVDVPGHERFVRNMLAGVGPVRLVLFVVAADEGWKPQSEEHLQILDVLGIAGGVVALTKRDLVDAETLEIAEEEVRERISGTVLHDAPIVPVSAVTGEGIHELTKAIDALVLHAPAPADERTRLFVDRVFSMKGAGTVLTGTLTGGCLAVGQEVAVFPAGRRARVRSVQSHRRAHERACHVSRVALNVVGAERRELERGDVVAEPGAWRPTSLFDARLRPVRGLVHPVTTRGAFKVHAGAAEADARLRFLEPSQLSPDGEAYVRMRVSRPLVLDLFDRFVLREAGRRETVAGGVVLDVDPRPRAVRDRVEELAARAGARRADVPGLLVAERGAIPVAEAVILTGAAAPDDLRVGDWLVSARVRDRVERALTEELTAFHRDHPLEEGAPLDEVRRTAIASVRLARARVEGALVEALLDDLVARGVVVRTASVVRLDRHQVDLSERTEDLDRLLAAVSGEHEATPPTVGELVAAGFGRDVIDAAGRAGVVLRIAQDLVVAPSLVERATALVRANPEAGVTVSRVREELATSRKYAVPLVEYLDRSGITRREGDLRYPR
jgi:selenocysteine-specific elongation factor